MCANFDYKCNRSFIKKQFDSRERNHIGGSCDCTIILYLQYLILLKLLFGNICAIFALKFVHITYFHIFIYVYYGCYFFLDRHMAVYTIYVT